MESNHFCNYSFLISTKATLNNNAKEWVIHLMSTLTGQDASFLTSTLTSGSAEELQGSATRAFQDSPTARPRLAFGPPASKSPPISISVPAGTVMELNSSDAVKYILATEASLEHPDAGQNSLAGGDHVPVDPPQLPLLEENLFAGGVGDQAHPDPPKQPLPVQNPLVGGGGDHDHAQQPHIVAEDHPKQVGVSRFPYIDYYSIKSTMVS